LNHDATARRGVVGRHVVIDHRVADVLMVAVRASLTAMIAEVRAVRASLTATIVGRVVMMVIARALIVVRESLTVMTAGVRAVRASSIAMIVVRVVMTEIVRALIVVRESLTGMTAGVRAVHASLIAMIAEVHVAHAGSTATSHSVHKPRRIDDAQRCSSAKVAVSTARTIPVRLAAMTNAVSSTKGRCESPVSVQRPTEHLLIGKQPASGVMTTAMDDISSHRRVRWKKSWRKKCVVRSANVVLVT
jgi:hypothetical protein